MRNRYLFLVTPIVAALVWSSAAYAQIYYSPSSQGRRTTSANAAAKAAPRPATFDKHDFSGVLVRKKSACF